ncbi:MAG: efflux RND transporter periplasmic adaptor subunit, partial [Cytophagaceae bacterium]
FDGTIGISSVKMGTFLTAGQTILNTISSDDPMSVDFVINEKEITRFMQLKEHKITKGDSLFTILLPDKSVYPYPGEIELFDRAVDPQTGTLRVRLRFPNPKRMLKAGMSAEVRVLNTTGREVVQIPYKAVTEQMGEFFVYVVERDTARQHKIMLGPPIGTNVIVFTGLNEGEKIVVEGIQKLKEGSPVQVGAPKQEGQNSMQNTTKK